MRFVLRVFFSLSLLWGGLLLCSQVHNVVSDGTVGIYRIGWKQDSAMVMYIIPESPAWNAGLRWNDIILEIGDSAVNRNNILSQDVLNMLALSVGDSVKVLYKSAETDSVKSHWLRADPFLSVWQEVEFEYLADSSGKWSIEDIASDAAGAIFSQPFRKKILVNSVKVNSKAEELGILPGDRIISLADELDGQLHRQIEEISKSDILYDTSLVLIRDSTLRTIASNPQEVNLTSGIESQFTSDLRSERIWLRFTIIPELGGSRKFILRTESYADTTFLFLPNGNGSFEQKLAGMKVDVKDKDLPYKKMSLFNLDLNDGEPVTVYILFAADDAIWLPTVKLIGKDEFLSYGTNERIFIGFLGGMLILVAFYYLVLFMANRKRSYLLYSLFILSFFHYLLFDWGYLAEMWPDYFRVIWDFYELIAAVPMAFFILFAMSYLEIRQKLPLWYRILKVELWLLGLCSAFLMIYFLAFGYEGHTGFLDIVYWVYRASLMVLPFGLLLIIPVLLIRKKFTPAWYFLIASLVMLGLLIYWTTTPAELRADTLYKSTAMVIFMNYGIYLGLIVQFIIFSAGLGRKMRGTELARKKAQARLIKQLKENDLLKDKVNRELEEKVQERTKEIMEQKEEIEAQRDEIGIQKDTVMAQKQEIMDSINYAQRIQAAVLPHEEFLDEVMPEHFILYRPRDVVSGDFYWVKEVKNFLVVVAADCTGHGVPGAFMSMLGISLLNEIVGKSRFDEPGEILDRLRKKVKETLTQEGKMYEQKDGMDMALAIIDRESLEVHFSGAFNPLYIIRKKSDKDQGPDENEEILILDNDRHQLLELKAHRQPIGIHEVEIEFTTTIFKLEKGDCLYMFSDGFQDQIGGPKAKKFLTKNFKRILLDVQPFNMIEQNRVLSRTLDEWSDGYEQVDDILLVGLRI